MLGAVVLEANRDDLVAAHAGADLSRPVRGDVAGAGGRRRLVQAPVERRHRVAQIGVSLAALPAHGQSCRDMNDPRRIGMLVPYRPCRNDAEAEPLTGYQDVSETIFLSRSEISMFRRLFCILIAAVFLASGPMPSIGHGGNPSFSIEKAEAGFFKKAIVGGVAGFAAKKGFVVCLKSQRCRMTIVSGGAALAAFLAERYGKPAAERCAVDPGCFGTIKTALEDRRLEAGAIIDVIKVLMDGGDISPAQIPSDNQADTSDPTPPEDPDENCHYKLINPSDVGYTQDSISPNFKDGSDVKSLILKLKEGIITADDVDPIRIFEMNGKLMSIDNRRLYAFKKAGVNIRYRWATKKEISSRRISTKDNGETIKVRKGKC